MAENETKIFKILGVKDDEIVILSEINDCKYCGEKSGQIHAITMRTISEEQIENSWDERELYDYWKDAVSSGNTYSGLSDWVEEVKQEQDENLPFCDDSSFRYETENALNELPKYQKNKIMTMLNDFCEQNGETYANIECSSCIHIDDDILKDEKGFYKSFQYKTPYFKSIYHILVDFSNGAIDYKTCIEKLNN